MKIPGFVKERVSLREATTLRIGGPARWLAEPENVAELKLALAFANDAGTEVKVIGGGSNLLVADSGIEAMVIRLPRRGEFGILRQNEKNPLQWSVGAAVPLVFLVEELSRRGVAGLEPLAGIPGRVGGAAAMNCGSGGNSVGAYITRARVCDFSGSELELDAKELAFSYRRSNLGRFIALAFEFGFTDLESSELLAKRMEESRAQKKERQPMQYASAGCFFKNPPDQCAGALIDAAGCKGMSVGGAEVSSLHANFIVNRGEATCSDVVELAKTVRERVRNRDGVHLEPEVVMWGNKDVFAPLMVED